MRGVLSGGYEVVCVHEKIANADFECPLYKILFSHYIANYF